jgi:cell division protein YceG involved in septum cleavage
MRLTPRGRIIATLGVLLLIVAVIALPGVLYLRSIGLLKASAPGGRVSVIIPRGASSARIGEILEDRGVVSSAFGFRIAVYLDGGAADIQAGRYAIATGLSAQDALAALERGPKEPQFARVTFPEGSWLEDFAAVLEHARGPAVPLHLRGRKKGRRRSRGRAARPGIRGANEQARPLGGA